MSSRAKTGPGEMTVEPRKGFTYVVRKEQIEEYHLWSTDRRLKWLFAANKMRKALPQKTIEECSYIDYLVCGEGEATIEELLLALEKNDDVSQIAHPGNFK